VPRVYIYVVARDFGFAPNPFHGVCTLATCKPKIRGSAHVGDWVIGIGGSKLNATGRCVFAMKVTGTTSFNQYWSHPDYFEKRPVRNGSRKMMVGDNIYYRPSSDQPWHQADSHHSRPDGSSDPDNVTRDTSADSVLISRHFFYFGRAAPVVPARLLEEIGYRNVHGHRVFPLDRCEDLISWLESTFADDLNMVSGRPFQFDRSSARFSVKSNSILC